MDSRSLRITSATQGRLRRLNLVTSLPPLLVAAVVLVAIDTHAWWHVLILVPGAAAALLAFERWTANDLARVLKPTLVVAVAVWPLGVLVTGSSSAWWGLSTVASLALPRLPRYRAFAVGAVIAYVAGVGSLRLVFDHDDVREVLLAYLILPTGLTAVVFLMSFLGERFYDVVQELEQSKEREAELAVTRERVRFAGDLHDIQGHTLHVVKLKAALAGKLVHTDPDRAAGELREIHALVGDTIERTKELAYAQRRLNLSAELENAKNLFEAAGIKARITREAEVDPRASELLGQVLRETTTNILRHAQATEVRMTLTAAGITIANDGARGDTLPELRGLSALRRRLAEEGGELTVAQHGDQFVTAAAYAPRAQPTAHDPNAQSEADGPSTQPTAGGPSTQPTVGGPRAQPAAQDPTVQPAAYVPYEQSAAQGPTRQAPAHGPTAQPATHGPTVQPAAVGSGAQPAAQGLDAESAARELRARP